MANPLISIVICTYNRASLLTHCLASLVRNDLSLCEVLVVDNNSSDRTQETIRSFVSSCEKVRTIFEPTQGLSHARNTGFKAAQGEWVAYLDDDAIVSDKYLDQLRLEISRGRFEVFGGAYLPWYLEGKKNWYLDTYGSNIPKETVQDVLKPGHYIDGGNAIFKKSLLEEMGGFQVELGMTGNKIMYGEETELQNRILKSGRKIGFSPEVLIFHLVPQRKQKVSWIIKSNFYNGRSYWTTHNLRPDFRDLTLLGLRVLMSSTRLLITLVHYPFSNKYFSVTNLMVENLGVIATQYGKLCAGLAKR